MAIDKKAKVLVVDDVAENAQVIVNTLKNEFNIVVATNGKKAVDIVNKNPDIDIILLDIMMPEMDGFEVCKILKSSNETKNIPIIFITALSDSSDEEKGLALGAVDYISKPINPIILKQRVKNHIELKYYKDHLERLIEETESELKKFK